jgi:hypothetical protein
MKKIAMAFATMIFMSTAVMAQNNGGQRPERQFDRAEMMKRQAEQMVTTYGLNQEQAEKLEKLNAEYADKLPMGMGMGMRGGRGGGQRPGGGGGFGNRPNGGGGNMGAPNGQRPSREQMEERMKEMRANQEAYNGELKKIMTEEQYKKYEADQQQRMQQRQQGGGGFGGGFGGGGFGGQQ